MSKCSKDNNKTSEKKIPYINVIKDDDESYSSEDQKEKPISKTMSTKKGIDDDRYDKSHLFHNINII